MWRSQPRDYATSDPYAYDLSDETALQADDSLPPVRSLPGEDPSWLVPTTSPPQRQQNVFQPQDQYRRQQQEQELQHGRQWAASPTSVGDHSVPELRLPSGAVWGHHVPAGQQPASADPHRQRILMAAHERAVRSMQHRQQSVQVRLSQGCHVLEHTAFWGSLERPRTAPHAATRETFTQPESRAHVPCKLGTMLEPHTFTR